MKMLVNKETLLKLLDDIKKGIENNDSFQGSFSYDYMHQHQSEGDKCIEVVATIRTGNSMGQGGMAVIPQTVIAHTGPKL